APAPPAPGPPGDGRRRGPPPTRLIQAGPPAGAEPTPGGSPRLPPHAPGSGPRRPGWPPGPPSPLAAPPPRGPRRPASAAGPLMSIGGRADRPGGGIAFWAPGLP